MPLIDHDEAINKLTPHFGNIYQSIEDGWKEWKKLPPSLHAKASARSRASLVHDFIVDNAAKRIDAKIFSPFELKLFVLSGYISLRFKKFNGLLKSCNQQTAQVKKFRNQELLDGIPAIHNIEAGYVLDEMEQNIDSVHLVCPNGRENYWQIQLNGNGAMTTIHTDIFDTQNNIDEQEPPATFRRKKSGVIVPIRKKDERA